MGLGEGILWLRRLRSKLCCSLSSEVFIGCSRCNNRLLGLLEVISPCLRSAIISWNVVVLRVNATGICWSSWLGDNVVCPKPLRGLDTTLLLHRLHSVLGGVVWVTLVMTSSLLLMSRLISILQERSLTVCLRRSILFLLLSLILATKEAAIHLLTTMLQRRHFEVLTLAVLSAGHRALALLFREQILEPCNFVFYMI